MVVTRHLLSQLRDQTGVTSPGGGLVEGVNHKCIRLPPLLLIGGSIGLIPIIAGHNYVNFFRLKEKRFQPARER